MNWICLNIPIHYHPNVNQYMIVVFEFFLDEMIVFLYFSDVQNNLNPVLESNKNTA